MTLDPDFEDFIRLLNTNEVEYLIVGGYALAFHGKPRYTGDLDIWIGISEMNAERLLKTIHDFGFDSLGFQKIDFLQEGLINQIGYPPLRIDILTAIDGVSFDEAYENKKKILINNFYANYIGYNDFIKNKKSSGRLQDLADIEAIKRKK